MTSDTSQSFIGNELSKLRLEILALLFVHSGVVCLNSGTGNNIPSTSNALSTCDVVLVSMMTLSPSKRRLILFCCLASSYEHTTFSSLVDFQLFGGILTPHVRSAAHISRYPATRASLTTC